MKLLILKGLPASGKTTYARDYVKKNKNWIRVNRDDLRNMRGEYWIPKQENLISLWEKSLVRLAFMSGYSVVLDDTNLNPRYQNVWIDIAKEFNAKVEYKIFKTSLNICIERDKNRKRTVGKDVINSMYKKFIIKNEKI